MKKFLTIFLATMLLCPLYSQGQTEVVHHELPRRFKVGDIYYPSTFRGVRNLMSDLQTEEPEMYDLMLPGFENLRRKMNTTLGVLGGTGIAGATLFVGSLTFWQVKDDFLKPDNPLYDPSAKKANLPVMFSGIGIIAAGGLISLFIAPDQTDVYNFVNTYNRNSTKRKMDWQIGLNLLNGSTPGISLTVRL
ncbi:MAG: hypothetical protein ACK4VN_04045 [Bacteroidales bacterium]